MYDEQNHRENNEECCQEGPNSIPLSCIELLRELYNQNVNAKNEQGSEETIGHLGDTKSEIEERSTHIGTLPLCYESFQILKGEWYSDNITETTHQPHIQGDYHENHEEFFETKID